MENVQPLGANALGKGDGQIRRGRAHVVADDHAVLAFLPHDVGEGRSDILHKVFVDILAHDASHVVGLHD